MIVGVELVALRHITKQSGATNGLHASAESKASQEAPALRSARHFQSQTHPQAVFKDCIERSARATLLPKRDTASIHLTIQPV
jgi:hypothetical protein